MHGADVGIHSDTSCCCREFVRGFQVGLYSYTGKMQTTFTRCLPCIISKHGSCGAYTPKHTESDQKKAVRMPQKTSVVSALGLSSGG